MAAQRKKTAKKKVAKKVARITAPAKTAAEIIGAAVNKGGRPTLYKAEYCQEIIEYFDIEPYTIEKKVHPKSGVAYETRVGNRSPTFGGFARKLGIARETLWHWSKAHPEFAYSMSRCEAIVEDILVTNGLLGLYDARFALFVGKNYTALRDVKETRELEKETIPETPDEIEDEIRRLDKKINRLKAQL